MTSYRTMINHTAATAYISHMGRAQQHRLKGDTHDSPT